MKETQTKGLERKQFIRLLGQSALGLWLFQFIPSVNFIPKPKRKKDPLDGNKYAKKVALHPLAVKRNKRG